MRNWKSILVGVIAIIGAGQASAQVPTSDAARLTQETDIANCMQKAALSREETAAPSRGIHSSFASPGQGGDVSDAGTAAVSGSAPAATSGGMAGQDFSSITREGATATSLRVDNFGQALASVEQATRAISSNTQSLRSLGQAIGSASGVQSGFDQNSGVRLNQASLWNQGLQIANTLASLRNMELLRQDAAASASHSFISYDRQSGYLVKNTDRTVPTDNTETAAIGTTTASQAEISAALKQIQDDVNTPATQTGSINPRQ